MVAIRENVKSRGFLFNMSAIKVSMLMRMILMRESDDAEEKEDNFKSKVLRNEANGIHGLNREFEI